MNDPRYCGNTDILMSYLYEDGDEHERRAFQAHLQGCERCATDAAELRAVRDDLAAWTPPETVLDFRIVRGPAPVRSRWAWLTPPAMPAWAQLAAASLVVGVAVGVSGLEIRYDQQGLVVRTGWSQPAAVRTADASAAAKPAGADAPWRADLVAVQEQMRNEWRQTLPVSTAVGPGQAAPIGSGKAMSDGEYMARVRQLIEASETRQQRELALRLTQFMRDTETQRRADMARVADGLGVLEGRTGAAVAQQREMMNYLVRVSQKQQ
jgi:anti-sigma factor RsiW